MFALGPQAMLGPLGGTLADRYSRRFLMIASDALSALSVVVLMYLFLTDSVELWHVYAAMFVRSALQAFQIPAATASVAMLVPLSFLPRAAGLNQTLQSISFIVAAPLGALALSVAPVGWALSIDVVTALMGIVPLFIWAIPQGKRGDEKTSVQRELVDGLAFVWKHKGLRQLYLLLGVAVMVVVPSFTLVPLLVKTHFAGGVQDVALIEGMGGLGMALGGIIVALVAPRRQLTWTLIGFSLSCLTVAFTAMVPGDWFWAAVFFWGVSGVTYVLGNAPMMAMLQSTIPNHMQGRALALLNSVMALASPVGLAIATPIGEAIGVRSLLILVGLLSGAAMLVGFASQALKVLAPIQN